MIRIDRGSEPDRLKSIRRKHLAGALLDRSAGAELTFIGYSEARKPLYDAQHRKCAYCERQQGEEGMPVEHFRPKAGAVVHDPRWGHPQRVYDADRYWWLAWSWENLLFACHTCNTGFKKDSFPLVPGTPRLPLHPHRRRFPAKCRPPGCESPLLIDPSTEDPLDHIAFYPRDATVPRQELFWVPVHQTERGRVTILVLGLDQHLPDAVTDHVRTQILPGFEQVEAEFAVRKPRAAAATWGALLNRLFATTQPYHSASYWALDFLLHTSKLPRSQFKLPRPGRSGAPNPPAELPDPSSLARVPINLLLRIRAGREDVRRLLVDLCKVRAWADADVAKALGKRPSTLVGHVNALLSSGQLRRDSAGKLRAPRARKAKIP